MRVAQETTLLADDAFHKAVAAHPILHPRELP